MEKYPKRNQTGLVKAVNAATSRMACLRLAAAQHGFAPNRFVGAGGRADKREAVRLLRTAAAAAEEAAGFGQIRRQLCAWATSGGRIRKRRIRAEYDGSLGHGGRISQQQPLHQAAGFVLPTAVDGVLEQPMGMGSAVLLADYDGSGRQLRASVFARASAR